MMDKQEITIKIKEIVVDLCDLSINPEEIPDDCNIVETYGIDDLDKVELIMDIEKNFEIEIPDSDVTPEVFQAITNLVELIYKRRHGRQ